MSIQRFVEVAREYQRLFPQVKAFDFGDEDFFARPIEEMRELAEIYPGQVGLPFECMASPGQVTEEKVVLATKAGMYKFYVGLESGSERVRREVFNRYVNDETQIKAAIAINTNTRVTAEYFLILGNPYEEHQDLLDGIRLLEKLPPPFSLRIYNLVFIPGTKLFERAVRDGIIKGVDDSGFKLDFLAGFDHRTHNWKRKNLYLNSLISMMVGKSSRIRMGFVPRRIIPFLTSPRVIDFSNRHTQIGETIVVFALFSRRVALAIRNK